MVWRASNSRGAQVEPKMLFGQHARPLQQPASPEAVEEDDADRDDRDARTGAPQAAAAAALLLRASS